MADEGKVLSREEIEQEIKRLDRQINGAVEGILNRGAKPDYDPNSQSAQEAAAYLKHAREQKGKRPVFAVWTDVLICPTMTL